ncbi:pseudouridine-5'-phosphate glycosidase [Hyaloraphidium curvatum]|nr:pseudouridine-5'-phosphate glycosidase [Hyaloraphidium curvatum]
MVLRRALSYWRHCARPRRLSTLSGLPPAVALSASVTDALLSRAPVVALETAIVTHGLPFPEALDAQLRAEAAVRNAGAIPASVGVLDGRIKVGLEAHELERLADPSKRPKSAIKAARRDLAFAVHSRLCAGTTVSATSHVASLVGIRVFATGGIGGAAPDPRYDISEDLLALEDTPVAVVCAGVKSIMDVAATLEHLETLGVPVATVSESGGSVPFPTFYTRDGPPSPLSLDPAELAGYLHAHFLLRPRTGALIAVPIPAEFEADGRLAQAAIDAARREAKERGITGKAWTPFVLDRVRVATKGASVVASGFALTWPV